MKGFYIFVASIIMFAGVQVFMGKFADKLTFFLFFCQCKWFYFMLFWIEI